MNPNPTPLVYVIGVNLVIFIFLIGHCSRPLISIGWMNVQILRRHIYHWPLPCCLGLERHSFFIVGSLHILNLRLVTIAKKKIDISYRIIFAFTARNIYFLFKIGRPSGKCKILPGPFFRSLDLSIFIKFLNIYLLKDETLYSLGK